MPKIERGKFSLNFRSFLPPKLCIESDKFARCKNGEDILYLHAAFGGYPAGDGKVRNFFVSQLYFWWNYVYKLYKFRIAENVLLHYSTLQNLKIKMHTIPDSFYCRRLLVDFDAVFHILEDETAFSAVCKLLAPTLSLMSTEFILSLLCMHPLPLIRPPVGPYILLLWFLFI